MSLPAINYLHIGRGGTFAATGTHPSTPADVDALVAHLGTRNPRRLVLHFHGGLVSETDGFAIAESLTPVYAEAGAHPVTIIWETGLRETVVRNLASIGQTKLFKMIVIYAIRHAAKALGESIGARGPGELPST